MMASPRLVQALDQLAGVAGDEIRQARDFQMQQNQRLQALAAMKEQQDREFNLEQGKLDVMRGQLKLAQETQKLKTAGDLAAKDKDLAEAKSRIDYLEQLANINKAKQQYSDAAIGAVLDQEQRLKELHDSGAPEQVVDDAQRFLNFLVRKSGAPADMFSQDVDFTAARQAKEAQPINPLSEKGTDLTLKYQKVADGYSQDYEVARNNMDQINISVNRLIENPDISRIATDEIVITSLKKILDPPSVVRESEYARTGEGSSLINRAVGWKEKLEKGGSGLTKEDLAEIRDVATLMVEARRIAVNEKIEQKVRAPAAKRGLDPEEIAPLFKPQGEQAAPTAQQNFQQINTPQQAPAPANDYDKYLNDIGLGGRR